MAALSRRLRPLRGPSSHERLWLASGCLRLACLATLPGAHERLFLASLTLYIRRMVGLEPIFLRLLVCLCGASWRFCPLLQSNCYKS